MTSLSLSLSPPSSASATWSSSFFDSLSTACTACFDNDYDLPWWLPAFFTSLFFSALRMTNLHCPNLPHSFLSCSFYALFILMSICPFAIWRICHIQHWERKRLEWESAQSCVQLHHVILSRLLSCTLETVEFMYFFFYLVFALLLLLLVALVVWSAVVVLLASVSTLRVHKQRFPRWPPLPPPPSSYHSLSLPGPWTYFS